jgi:hypothetical protein
MTRDQIIRRLENTPRGTVSIIGGLKVKNIANVPVYEVGGEGGPCLTLLDAAAVVEKHIYERDHPWYKNHPKAALTPEQEKTIRHKWRNHKPDAIECAVWLGWSAPFGNLETRP